jgi:predicted XRE-type DNA-binding protein
MKTASQVIRQSGFTQAHIAREIGVCRSYVCMVANGTRTLGVLHSLRLAELCGLHVRVTKHGMRFAICH